MDCIKIKSLITDYLYGEADEESVRLVEDHIDNCDECSKNIELNRKALGIYRSIKKTPPPVSAVTAALNESRARREAEFVNRKTQRVISLRPYLKYMKHPFFAAASVVIVVGILVTSTWQDDESFIAENKSAVSDSIPAENVSGEDRAELPPLAALGEKENISADLSALVEKAAEATQYTKASKLKVPQLEKNKAPVPDISGVIQDGDSYDALSGRKARSRKAAAELDSIVAGKSVLSKAERSLAESAADMAARTEAPGKKMQKTEPAAIIRDAAVAARKDEEGYIALTLKQDNVKGPELQAGAEFKKPANAFAAAKPADMKDQAEAEEVAADVVADDPKEAKDILKKAFELYQKHKYNDALYYLGKVPDTAGDITVAAVELEVLCHNYLDNKEAVEQGLDVLTRLDPALGARLAREIGMSRKAASEGTKTKMLTPRSSSLETR
ncbi:MAG: anti-sigma factor family protein [Planctomycetota bacterium]|jgi:hypothetical protein